MIKLKPFWAPKDVNGEALLDQYSLGNLATLKKGLSLEGAGSGDLDFTHKLDGSIPVKVNMDLGIDRLKLPGLNHALIKIPPLKFSTSKINGSVEAGKTLKFESLELGRKSDKIHLDLNFDFGLDRSGMPTSGNLAGRLKVDPEFEKNELASIKTELIFGPVKASGYREFKQVVKGSLMPFLLGIKQ